MNDEPVIQLNLEKKIFLLYKQFAQISLIHLNLKCEVFPVSGVVALVLSTAGLAVCCNFP